MAGWLEMEPSRRQAFLASREETMRRSRAEPGCLEYTFGADPLEPGRVVLLERWETQAALDAHVAALRAGPPAAEDGVAPTASSVVVYEVASERPLGG